MLTDEIIRKQVDHALLNLEGPQYDVAGELCHEFCSAIVGGAVRDWSLGRSPRDIDICVDAYPEDLEAWVKANVRRYSVTSFGGYRLHDAKIDVWPITETWGIKRRDVTESFAEVSKSVFLNADSGVVALNGAMFPMGIHVDTMLDCLNDRMLDIVFQENPNPAACAAKALRLSRQYDLCFSPRLVAYIEQAILDHAFSLAISYEIGKQRERHPVAT